MPRPISLACSSAAAKQTLTHNIRTRANVSYHSSVSLHIVLEVSLVVVVGQKTAFVDCKVSLGEYETPLPLLAHVTHDQRMQ